MSYLVMQSGETHEVAEKLPSIDCFCCGICCVRYRPKVGDEEITTMTSELGISPEVFVRDFIRILPKTEERILDNGGDQCPFLSWDKDCDCARCTIHPFHPEPCRNWQASLSRAECQEGLQKLKPQRGIILPQDMYSSQEEINGLTCTLEEEQKQND